MYILSQILVALSDVLCIVSMLSKRKNKIVFYLIISTILFRKRSEKSKNVLELHGSVLRNYCMNWGKFFDEQAILESEGIPRCECGGIIKPDVVLYEEPLNQRTIFDSIEAIADADLLIVAGTSLTVYPAAGLVDYYRGDRLVLINRDATPYDDRADLVFHESLGNIFSEL